jgi:hypothetical protein
MECRKLPQRSILPENAGWTVYSDEEADTCEIMSEPGFTGLKGFTGLEEHFICGAIESE